MNLDRWSERLDAIAAALSTSPKVQAEVEKLRAEVNEARAERDPFASHIYAARRKYRAAVANAGKSMKHADTIARQSHLHAEITFGFRGGFPAWREILRPGA